MMSPAIHASGLRVGTLAPNLIRPEGDWRRRCAPCPMPVGPLPLAAARRPVTGAPVRPFARVSKCDAPTPQMLCGT
jgi:hypothetical protein